MSRTLPTLPFLSDLFQSPLNNLIALNISDNELSDEELAAVMQHLMDYTNLTSLDISGNFLPGRYNEEMEVRKKIN